MTEWQDIATAPRDGTTVLLGGRYRPFDILPGGEWCSIIAAWSTFSSVPGAQRKWIANLSELEHWNVDFTHWAPIPSPPADARGGGR